MKPTLDLYIGRKVVGVTVDEEDLWKWAIVLEDGVQIVNKSRQELFAPMLLEGYRIGAISMSGKDTTVHFMGPVNAKISISFNPTQYAIHDPRYGGEAYPQWPEELEEAGIPSHPDEQVSSLPSVEWQKARRQLQQEQYKRQDAEQTQWMEEDANGEA